MSNSLLPWCTCGNRDVRTGKYSLGICQSHFSSSHLQVCDAFHKRGYKMTQIMAIIWEVLPGINTAVWHKLKKCNRPSELEMCIPG